MNLQEKSMQLRAQVIEMIHGAKAGHVGGDMSVMDILVSLYYEQLRVDPQHMDDPRRDRFVLSKGHCVEALYAVLADRGFLDPKELATYFSFGSHLIGHPNNQISGIEMNSGALGHGLSVCTGMAIAAKLQRQPYRVYTVMGDGELAEGSIWEAVECAAQYQLDNLCAVIDQNGLQISGTTDAVMSHGDLARRFAAYNWHVVEVDGHDFGQLRDAFETAKRTAGRPTAVIAKTIKGKGVSFMENNVTWHHKVLNDAQYAQALQELAQRGRECVQ